MSAPCGGCCAPPPPPETGSYRRVLWAALAINAAMFAIEVAAGEAADSMSLKADALDFFGDAANYALSLAVLGLTLRHRAAAALVKGISMGLFGLWVAGETLWRVVHPGVPEVFTMGAVGTLALGANLSVAAMLFAWRTGDSNMRSVWLCTRNDAIGNLAVLGAAGTVWLTGTGWVDLIVAAMMAALALTASIGVVRQAAAELAVPAVRPAR